MATPENNEKRVIKRKRRPTPPLMKLNQSQPLLFRKFDRVWHKGHITSPTEINWTTLKRRIANERLRERVWNEIILTLRKLDEETPYEHIKYHLNCADTQEMRWEQIHSVRYYNAWRILTFRVLDWVFNVGTDGHQYTRGRGGSIKFEIFELIEQRFYNNEIGKNFNIHSNEEIFAKIKLPAYIQKRMQPKTVEQAIENELAQEVDDDEIIEYIDEEHIIDDESEDTPRAESSRVVISKVETLQSAAPVEGTGNFTIGEEIIDFLEDNPIEKTGDQNIDGNAIAQRYISILDAMFPYMMNEIGNNSLTAELIRIELKNIDTALSKVSPTIVKEPIKIYLGDEILPRTSLSTLKRKLGMNK